MIKCDLGTTVTLLVFFLIGLFAGSHLRSDGMEAVLLTPSAANASIPAPAAPALAAAFAPQEARAPQPVLPARPSPRASVPASEPPKRASQSASPVPAVAAAAAGGGARAGREAVPASNRFAGLERFLEKLPLPIRLLPAEPIGPPTTTAHVMSNVSLQPVLPEVFVPCCAKTGTTFLWGCTSTVFQPALVCGSNRAADWTVDRCGAKRYSLKGIRILDSGCRVERKEFFFWGGGKGEDNLHYPSKGLRWLTGMPTPLHFWERNARACTSRADVERLCYENLPADIPFDKIRRPRNQVEVVPEDGRIHPACKKLRIRKRRPAEPGAGRPLAALAAPTERIQLDVECALPWVDRRRYAGAVNMDFTPNHMADARTPLRLWANSPAPRRLKFVVTLRDPLKRAYSEWSMFVRWNWERIKDFGQKLHMELDALKLCNATVFNDPSLILTLSHDQFTRYHTRCFSGQAMEYVRNSMYIIGFRSMMRVFEPSQFLVIWSEVRPMHHRARSLLVFARRSALPLRGWSYCAGVRHPWQGWRPDL